MMSERDAIETLKKWVDEGEKIVFFGGAGVSTESGIPDFRSVDGLYSQRWKYPPETVLSHSFFLRHTEEFYEFYREKMLSLDAKPNRAHLALAALERAGKLSAVITQNIDGLHQAAGSKRVIELHGSVHRNRCQKCGRRYDARFIASSVGIPTCECGGVIKPEVVLYDEQLDDEVINETARALRYADLAIVAGTSLTVYPAAAFLEFYPGDRLALINRDPTPFDSKANLVIHGLVGEVLEKVVDVK